MPMYMIRSHDPPQNRDATLRRQAAMTGTDLAGIRQLGVSTRRRCISFNAGRRSEAHY